MLKLVALGGCHWWSMEKPRIQPSKAMKEKVLIHGTQLFLCTNHSSTLQINKKKTYRPKAMKRYNRLLIDNSVFKSLCNFECWALKLRVARFLYRFVGCDLYVRHAHELKVTETDQLNFHQLQGIQLPLQILASTAAAESFLVKILQLLLL